MTEIAAAEDIDLGQASKMSRLAHLAPDLIEAIASRRLEVDISQLLRQCTTSGLECSRGPQRTEREKRRKARLGRRLTVGHAQKDKAGNRANTGGTGKKNPNRIRVGTLGIGGAGRNRTAVRKCFPNASTCLAV
jgi:hypothetical protein